MTDQPAEPTARVEVVGGGTPSPEELAAVVVALTPVVVVDDHRTAEAVPAWAQAALLENVGRTRVSSRAELTGPGGVR